MTLISEIENDDRSRLFWRLQALGWGGCAVVVAVMGCVVYWPVGHAIMVGIIRGLFGVAVTSLLLRPLLRGFRRRRRIYSIASVVSVFFCSAALGLADALFIGGVSRVLNIEISQPGVRSFITASIFIRGVLYLIWCILYFGVHRMLDMQQDQLRTARAESAARLSELQMLRAQVNPHFLFNALNSILAEAGNAAAVRHITLALAEYLRFSLTLQDNSERLGVELDALENYLRVEKARFEADLEYRIDAGETARATRTPVALVQPLIENAIKYGQHSQIRPWRIEVAARVEGEELFVTVTNTGEWVENSTSTKTGLANLRRRLELLYIGKAELSISHGGGEVRAQVRLPLEHRGDAP